jgi:hypothetical protein
MSAYLLQSGIRRAEENCSQVGCCEVLNRALQRYANLQRIAVAHLSRFALGELGGHG